MSCSLKQIDIEFMRRLHTRVNLIPVIAKADTLTDEEIADFKARVRPTLCSSRARSDHPVLDSCRHRSPQDSNFPGTYL